VSSLANGITHLSGPIAYLLIALLVFGETAVFLGFFLPGEIAVVLGGVLASHGRIAIGPLIAIVVAAAVLGPLAGYEIGRRMGDRLFSTRLLARLPGGADRARVVLRDRGGLGVLLGRFVAIVRALMPAAAGAVGVRYRTFVAYNVVGGALWGAGYCLVGYLAGDAYTAVERRVGTGLAIAVAVIVVAGAALWAVRRHRAAASVTAATPVEPDPGASDG
jgi:membrane-associated protein